MAEDPEKYNGEDEDDGSAEEGENDRPTVSPPFDPVAFAREILRPSPVPGMPVVVPPSGDLPSEPPVDSQNPHTKATPPRGVRPPAPSLSDPGEDADPQVRAIPRAGPPRGPLSLANARVPSNLPPKLESLSNMNAVDREWAELEISTRPPPPGANPEDILTKPPAAGPLPDIDDPGDMSASEEATKPPSDPVIEIIEGPATEEEMHDRVALGDYSGALEIAEKLLEADPENAAVNACAENCRNVLKQMYSARIGPLDRVPLVMIPRDQLRWLTIDHKAGFVLSLVDGVSSLEMILDVSGMPELDALRILSELAQQRIISFR